MFRHCRVAAELAAPPIARAPDSVPPVAPTYKSVFPAPHAVPCKKTTPRASVIAAENHFKAKSNVQSPKSNVRQIQLNFKTLDVGPWTFDLGPVLVVP